jgi:Flp pilus assembly protein TadG
MASDEHQIAVRQRVRSRLTWGSLSVEMAMVAPILILLLFGTMEMGLLFRDSLVLGQAAREGARVAAVGALTTDISTRARAAAPSLVTANITVAEWYRTYSSGTWGVWTTLTDNTGVTANVAPSGAHPHPLVTGGLFASMANPGTNTVTVKSSMVMMRE